MSKDINIEIGRRIYERRKQLGITQEYLAELTDTTPQAISNYERGKRELNASITIKMSKALRTTTDFLLTGNDSVFSVDNDIHNLSNKNKATLNEIIERCIKLTEK